MTHTSLVMALLGWFRRHARPLPWRSTRDPYAIWVSEIMLQQTQVKTVMPYWERWVRALPNLRALADAEPERLQKLWEGLGYYTRVWNLHKAAKLIVADHGGRFPERPEDVLALPGIGRYTAGAICSIAFDQPQPILDGNVVRVLTRLFGIDGDPRSAAVRTSLWRLAEELVLEAASIQKPGAAPAGVVPPGKNGACSAFNQSLMELGALVCTAKRPRCEVCPVGGRCVARRDGRIGELPQRTIRPGAIERRFVAFLVQSRKRFLVRQRPAGVINAHLWEFPNVELAGGGSDLGRAAHQALGLRKANLVHLATIQHSITRYRIKLEVCQVVQERAARPAAKTGSWLTEEELARLPMPSAHKKILERHVPTLRATA